MKVYVVGNFDVITDVVFEEESAIKAYNRNLTEKDGAWVQVWVDNEMVHDSIYDKIQ